MDNENEQEDLEGLHSKIQKGIKEGSINPFSLLEGGYSYFCHHQTTGEEWYLLGIDLKGNRVCAAGWPPSIAKLSDCCNFRRYLPLTPEELEYRESRFGCNWI